MTAELDGFLAGYEAPRSTVSITARADLITEHQAATTALNKAIADDQTLAGSPERAALAAKVLDLEEEITASSMTFTFRSIGRRAWIELVANHPPRDEDKGMDYNPESFPPAAVAACSSAPELTELDVARLQETLSLSQWMKLWQAVLSANLGDDAAPKSLIASAVHRLSDASPSTAAPEGSLAASS